MGVGVVVVEVDGGEEVVEVWTGGDWVNERVWGGGLRGGRGERGEVFGGEGKVRAWVGGRWV